MGTRSTQTVGAATATRAIEAALKSGKLSLMALGDMLETVSDESSPGSYNFQVVHGQGADDDEWVRFREELQALR